MKLRLGDEKLELHAAEKRVEHMTLQHDVDGSHHAELRFGKDLQPIHHMSVSLMK